MKEVVVYGHQGIWYVDRDGKTIAEYKTAASAIKYGKKCDCPEESVKYLGVDLDLTDEDMHSKAPKKEWSVNVRKKA